MKTLFVSSRSCTVLVDEQGDFYARQPYTLTLDGSPVDHGGRSVVSLFGLWPDTEYELALTVEGGQEERLTVRTEP